ncbi:putative interleukin-17 receptor E-like [Hippoglossus hippoglossus]|uniref:putative interleukin-17 receptor E-like n=1 Tax=Hippoglossus hippoglossus TaxID=8267 RepID=UPI00148CB86F|nr:putative interleukin-17 receptor E-like [Hippoglossus hippoglossus]
MILWVALLTAHCCLGLNGAAAEGTGLDRIEKCSTRCSQGLHCKARPDYIFHPPCQEAAGGLNTSSVFHNISFSTVMMCEGRQKCSLQLRIKTALQLTESIQGVSICTMTAGMMMSCRILKFTRSSGKRMSGLQVEVENDCTSVSPNQRVQVVVKTLPSYCGITWTGTYNAPACISEDMRRHVPDCITGRLSYNVNPVRKELSVSVSEMMEDHNYNLRLCYKDFLCSGAGTNLLIKKEEPVKSVTLPYSRPLPCLCIEGWSAVMDAPRVQVCPFKDRLKELWFGITFDPLEETLSWELVCPVATVVALCQTRKDGVCVDLPNASRNVSRGKIRFTEVDPHPQLCVKFTVGSQFWTRCPFADGRLQAWDVVVTRQRDREQVAVTSRINATFSVGLCVTSAGPAGCQINKTHRVHVGENEAVGLNLSDELRSSCVQVRRLDVKYTATVIHCVEQRNRAAHRRHVVAGGTSWDLIWAFVPVGVCLSGIISVTLLLHVLLTVYLRRRKQRGNEKQKDPPHDCVVPATHQHGGILIPDSPLCGNTEKANLLSE